MIEYSIYPRGKRRIVTFSYDDGPANDDPLVALFNQYGVKGTFHLNGRKYLGMTQEEKMKVRTRYRGHEIACHTLQHGWLERMPGISIVNEIIKDRQVLEEIAGYPVVGMSYPNGSVSQFAADTMAACGIVYSRTTGNTKKMKLPQDFLFWHPPVITRTRSVCVKTIWIIWTAIGQALCSTSGATAMSSAQKMTGLTWKAS